jgi:CheY-like chemotaxis protein
MSTTPRRVLIVDDEDDIREVAQLSLEMVAGWQVLTARSGGEAVACAHSDRPDAILLDVMMPDMDGPTTFRRLQENPATRHIPVVLLTAKVQAADQLRLGGLGVAGVLEKPFDPMRLAGDVAAILGWT